MYLHRFLPVAVALCAGLLTFASIAQPALPAGLEGRQSSEPALPSGMGETDDWGSEWPDEMNAGNGEWSTEEWEIDEQPIDPGLNPLTGFWELRLGNRFSPADNQRDASLAEARLELEKDVQWQTGSAKLTVDAVYDAIEDSRHLDLDSGAGWLDLREAWLSHRLAEKIDIKLGRQILTWGVGDLIFINDLFPKDWNSFLAGRDEQFLKAPSDALRIGWYSDAINLNLIYTPRFDADRYIDGRRLSYFSPLYGEVVGQNGLLDADQPDHTGEDDEWALRFYRSLGSYEVALYGYHGFWKSPGGFDPLTGAAIFPRLSVVGASARGPLGPGILSLETGYYHSLDDGDGGDPFVNNSEFRALAGYEWELLSETTLGLQYYLEALQDYGSYRQSLGAGQPQRDEYRQLLTARLTRLAMNQNLTLSLFIFYSPTDRDAYLRPKVNYKVTDNWMVEAGMNLFSGQEAQTFFGQFEDNSNFYGAIRYSF